MLARRRIRCSNVPGSRFHTISSLVSFEDLITCSSGKIDTSVCRCGKKAAGRVTISIILRLTKRQYHRGVSFSCCLNEGDDEKKYCSLSVSIFDEESGWILKVSWDENQGPSFKRVCGQKMQPLVQAQSKPELDENY